MNNFSKLSLYDFLAMLIPGFVILWLLDFVKLFPEDVAGGLLLGTLSYIVGLCYHKVVELLFKVSFFWKLRDCLKKCAWDEFYYKKKGQEGIPEYNKDNYEKSYYRIAKNGCLMNIPILEAQEAFLRNSFLLNFCSICKISCSYPDATHCSLILFLVIVFVTSIIMCVGILQKIYYLVWEGDYNLRIFRR